MKIEIVGTGCEKCKKMYETVKSFIDKKKLTPILEYTSGNEGKRRLVELGVDQSPTLVINDEVVLSGYPNDTGKIEKALLSI